MSTTLIFVRHGQSQSNLDRVFTGQENTDLTELGIRQAEATAQALSQYPIRHIYSSDLSRAFQTAEVTANLFGLPVIAESGLREIFAGDWEGKPYDDLRTNYPESYARWLTDIGNAHPDHGESVKELATRVYATVEKLLQRHNGECIALFSHATPMRVMGCRWMGISVENAKDVPWGGNASICVAEYHEDGSFQLISYGDDSHQGDLKTNISKGDA